MSEWKILCCVVLFVALAGARARAESHELKSPDGRIGVQIETGPAIRYSVRLDGRPLTGPNPLSMILGDQLAPGGGFAGRLVPVK